MHVYPRKIAQHPQANKNRAITFCFGKVITCNGERVAGSTPKSSFNCKAYNSVDNTWENVGELPGIGMRR